MQRPPSISAAEARRIALAAQGFDRPRPKRPDRRHIRRVLDTLGLLQLDYVNVLIPAHYLVLWSRLGGYDPTAFERVVHHSGGYTEQWAHEASIVPVDTWPLLRHRRKAWQPHPRTPPLEQGYLDRVFAAVRDAGPLTATDLPAVPGPRRKPGDWHRSIPRRALEYHFATGKLASCGRMPNFQRLYDLPERVIPAEHLHTRLRADDARRELLRRAGRALGIATADDLVDYFRMSPTRAKPLLNELVEEGTLIPVAVDGWKDSAYRAAAARCPRQVGGASLVSPFDPLIWFRPRALRLFDLHYRIEIYVPAAKRRWGYYVLPFRLGDAIVARVDLKADRKAGLLRVQNLHLEDGAAADATAAALAEELTRLAGWLTLDSVRVRERHPFANALRDALRSRQ